MLLLFGPTTSAHSVRGTKLALLVKEHGCIARTIMTHEYDLNSSRGIYTLNQDAKQESYP